MLPGTILIRVHFDKYAICTAEQMITVQGSNKGAVMEILKR